ncbi:hypothetical protein DPMN_119463 [Dreissena polymorpha]|uniref:Uncharacterized protein n=1 Tax=Dreissena polymorpha TaxID=45954 RepID=A0A9D4GQ09_DREPO|nr:hypothetical protein DPMN_119463 [Dreissena polymorpha]
MGLIPYAHIIRIAHSACASLTKAIAHKTVWGNCDWKRERGGEGEGGREKEREREREGGREQEHEQESKMLRAKAIAHKTVWGNCDWKRERGGEWEGGREKEREREREGGREQEHEQESKM